MPGQGGHVVWTGPSRFDGTPIVVIVTRGATNRKTGPMDQSWVLPQQVHPFHATRTGEDAAVCGTCRHRGSGGMRSCYVTVQHGPAAVWRAFQAGRYPPADHGVVNGRFLRIGSYGDPTAAPVSFWLDLLPRLTGWTGYTHFWRDCDPRFREFLMASVDTELESFEASAAGWRTFRVRHTGARLLRNEIVCPASKEAGHRLTCQQCRVCSGALSGRSQKHVAIYAHGPNRVNFFRSAQEVLAL